MSTFPLFSEFPKYVAKSLQARSNEPSVVNKMNAWVRISSGANNGLSILSNPDQPLFAAAGEKSVYGEKDVSGTIGMDWTKGGGNPVYSNNDLGYRPRPNISSIEIDEQGGGLSRKASFSITV